MRSIWAVGLCMAMTILTSKGMAGNRASETAARAEAIRATLADINEELKAHGGTWEKWAESLNPYREDIRAFTTDANYKWPWPAKNGYLFHGAEIEVQLLDSFDNLPEGERPLDSLLHFNKQLKALGIDLIVAIIPAKLTTYPDYIYAASKTEINRPARAPEDRNVSMAVKRLMKELLENDVEVVDLHKAFADFRKKNGDGVSLFYVKDAHYVNRGARLCAEKIGEEDTPAQRMAAPDKSTPAAKPDGTRARTGPADIGRPGEL
jgi:hypothetical protein